MERALTYSREELMNHKKLEFFNDAIHIVKELCKLVFNISSDLEVVRIFGITNEQMEAVIRKITDQLPDDMFNRAYPQVLDEIKNIFAKEFIFFHVQERPTDPKYADDLSNFIYAFSRDIQKRF